MVGLPPVDPFPSPQSACTTVVAVFCQPILSQHPVWCISQSWLFPPKLTLPFGEVLRSRIFHSHQPMCSAFTNPNSLNILYCFFAWHDYFDIYLLDMILNIAHNFTSIATKGYNAIYQHRTTYPLILKKNIKCLMQYCPDSQCWGLNLVPVDDTTPSKL